MDIPWKRSTRCSSNGCVEVSRQDGKVLVRDSKKGEDSPVLEFTPSGWRVFVAVALEFVPGHAVRASGMIVSSLDGVEQDVCVLDEQSLRHLHLTTEEWDAFVAGAKAGEFDVEALTR